MNVVDLHPEELLDKAARGELSADEHVRLSAHLVRCSACRAERVLRADFAAELDGDDRDSAIIGLVQGALAAPRAPVAPAANAPGAAPVPVAQRLAADTELDQAEVPIDEIPGLARRLRRPRRTAALLLVAAAVLAASAASATGLTGRVWLRLGGGDAFETKTHASATIPAISA